MNTETKPQLTEWEREQALEFTRHYDNLLWVVTSLLTTANAALMALAGERLSIQVGALGIALSILTVFFAASFRLLRRQVHDRLDEDSIGRVAWLYGGAPGWIRQWPVYVVFFGGVAALWISLLFQHFPQYRCIWWITIVVSAVLLSSLYFMARSHTLPMRHDADKRRP